MTIEEIIRNKATLIAQKKAAIKYADGVMGDSFAPELEKTIVIKSDSNTTDPTQLQVKAVINTTNILDSHGDVHIKGLWSKSLKENKLIMHLQEHQLKFDKIISDGKDLKASVKNTTFKELGYKLDGETQALIFDSTIKMDRNEFMFEQYKKGIVKNHSVGMQYVKLFLAVNDENYKEEKSVWDKYYPTISNKSTADERGYFWAVTEAKIIEGSAVPIGNNQFTPTIATTEAAKTGTSQQIEPLESTQKLSKSNINLLNLL